jgi:very-short-patch-repair endonuclease
MAYNPKKRVKGLLKKAKKALKMPKTKTQKDEFIKKQAKKMDKKPTKPERLFAKILKELKIKYRTQEIVGGKIFDFYLVDSNTLAEVDGDYWHGKDVSLTERNGMQVLAKRNDSEKNVIAKGYKYGLFRVWESDLLKKYEEVKERVKRIFVDGIPEE